MQDTAYLKPEGDSQSYVMTKAEGISTQRDNMTPVEKMVNWLFRLYFPEIPSNTTKMDFFEGSTTGIGTPFSVWGIELNQ